MSSEHPRTLRDLVQAFTHSPEGLSAANSTKRFRRRAFTRFLRRFGGTTSISFLEDRGTRTSIYDWRDTFAATPAEGNQTILAVSMLFNWAVDRGYARDNPAAGLKPLGPKHSSRSDRIWEQQQIGAFLEAADRPLKEIFLTALWTGMRESDIFSLSARDCSEGWITYKPQKTRRSTGVTVHIPYYTIPVLVPLFVHLSTFKWKPGEPMFRSPAGRPWSQSTLSYHWPRTLERAGLQGADLTFHDLRGTFVTRLIEAGCTDAEVGVLTGHSVGGGSIKAYAARTRCVATNAYQKLLDFAGDNYEDAKRQYFAFIERPEQP